MSRSLNIKSCLVISISLLSLKAHSQEYKLLSFEGDGQKTDSKGTVKVERTTYATTIIKNSSDVSETQNTTTEVPSTQNGTEVAGEKKNKTEEKYVVKDICSHFTYAGKINLNRMVDLWQTTYYRGAEKVPCFKMFIRKLTMKEKQLNKLKYGNFDDAVEWEDCNLELRSSVEINKHFLQGCEKGHGVLENVIIGKQNDSDTDYVFNPESPNQWQVVQNLLLMRDCDTGEVVVFSRVPHKPDSEVIIDALKQFGEENTDGKFICGDQPPIKKKNNIRFEKETEESAITTS